MTAGPVILLSGGGTGGHVFPSLAVADALVAQRPDTQPQFVGTARGLEARLVPAAGWMLHEVEMAPLARKLSPDLAKLPGVVRRAVAQVAALIRCSDVAAAVVFGGYVSVPLALAARRVGIPLIVHEQNAVPGIANRFAARWADAVALSVPDTPIRTRGSVVCTGNPVRPGIVTADRAALRASALDVFGLEPTRRTLLVFGGSQGAARINAAAVATAGRWADPNGLQILHLTGPRSYDEVAANWAAAKRDGLLVACEAFVERMDLAYAAADVVVSRAGASTIAELTVLGLPSILVPYPHATGDHQRFNAVALATAGAAVVIGDSELDGSALLAAAQPLLGDLATCARMAQHARAAGRADAAAAVAELVFDAVAQRANGVSTRPRKPARGLRSPRAQPEPKGST